MVSLMILTDILQQKKERLEQAKQGVSIGSLKEWVKFLSSPARLSFLEGSSKPFLIAEAKRVSPSKGVINGSIHLPSYVQACEKGGAKGLSVLTEEDFFHGSLKDLYNARTSSTLPVLRKDFLVDPYQIWESRAWGADWVLIIARILDRKSLDHLYGLTREMGMEALVEVHSLEDVKKAVTIRPKVIGINNRSLEDFSVDMSVTEKLLPLIPSSTMVISESGIKTRDDLLRLNRLGVRGFLVGEALVRNPDPQKKIEELLKG
jgi:indole-3-glycerol phosphate synthase